MDQYCVDLKTIEDLARRIYGPSFVKSATNRLLRERPDMIDKGPEELLANPPIQIGFSLTFPP